MEKQYLPKMLRNVGLLSFVYAMIQLIIGLMTKDKMQFSIFIFLGVGVLFILAATYLGRQEGN